MAIKSPVIEPIIPPAVRIAPPPSSPDLLAIKSPITVPNEPFISIAPPPLYALLPIKSPKIISIFEFVPLLEIIPPQPPWLLVPALLPINLPCNNFIVPFTFLVKPPEPLTLLPIKSPISALTVPLSLKRTPPCVSLVPLTMLFINVPEI